MAFLNDIKFRWCEANVDGASLFYRGDKKTAQNISDVFLSSPNDVGALSQEFQKINRYTSGVLETEAYIFGWVDHIRSWPLFYTKEGHIFFVSPNAYMVKDSLKKAPYNENSLLEFKLSGYVIGANTLAEGVSSLSPGEFFIWNKKKNTLNTHKYFSYVPTFDRDVSYGEALKEQGCIFDSLTLRIIKEAKGKTIWVPLSGGLDSRILLCKLHEHGYKNIETFTYGPRFNFEGLVAKKVAKKLNVPWRFVAIPRKILKKYFQDNNRKEFFKFSGNLKTVPCMREYGAIRYLHETGQVEAGAIFLNGQSGDYISGGHLSKASKEDKNYNKETFYKIIIDKHYDLWRFYKTPENLKIVKEKIDVFLKSMTGDDVSIQNQMDGAKYEEAWEYEGRQICYVSSGQRAYEYFGYDWEMPLWEKSFVEFYASLPFEMKYNQKFYKDYLHHYNYKELFPSKEPYIWRWSIPMLWVVPVAQLVGLLGGRASKDKFYAKMRYFGHYANQYAFFDFKEHVKTAYNARNIISLYVLRWLKDHEVKL